MEQVNQGGISMNSVEGQYQQAFAPTSAAGRPAFNQDNYLSVKLPKGDTAGKTLWIRILPPALPDQGICTQIDTHAIAVSKEVSKSGFKTFICLNDQHIPGHESKPCPICARAESLMQEGGKLREKGDEAAAKTMFQQGGRLRPRKTCIIRCIERGREADGPKFWRFPMRFDKKDCYNSLLNLWNMRKAEYERQGQTFNIFDLEAGKDIALTLSVAVNGKGDETTNISISDASAITPLSNDKKQADAWVNDPKKWSDVYGVKSAAYLQLALDGLTPVFNREANAWVAKETEVTDAQRTPAPVSPSPIQPSNEMTDDDIPF